MKKNESENQKLIQVLKTLYIPQSYELLSSYFEKISLILEERSEHSVTFFSFYNYFKLPYFVSDKIFYAIRKDRCTNFVTRSEFVDFSSKLYKGTIEQKIQLFFYILDVHRRNLIDKENTRLFVIHLIVSSHHPNVQEAEFLISNFFNTKNEYNFEEFKQKTLHENSDLFFLLNYFIMLRKPFSDSSIEFYEEYFPFHNSSCKLSDYDTSLLKHIKEPTEDFYNVLECFTNTVLEELNDFEISVTKYIKLFNSESIKKKPASCQNFHKLLHLQKPESEKEPVSVYQTIVGTNDNSKLFKLILSPSKKPSALPQIKEIETKYTYNFKNVNDLDFQVVIVGSDMYLFEVKKQLCLKLIIPIKDISYKTLKETPNKLYIFSMLSNTPKDFQMNFEEEEYVEEVINIIKGKNNYITLEDEYLIDSIVGKGSYGTVAKAENTQTHETVAIKILKKDYLDIDIMKCVRNEQDIALFLNQLPHMNLVEIKDVVETAKAVYIVQEYLQGGNLENYVLKTLHKENMTEEKRVEESFDLISQISRGISYYSSFGIVHRDLKPSNILLKKNNSKIIVKIIDFGLAKIACSNETLTEKYGSLLFLAPEMFDNKPYSNKVDVWSFGLIAYFIIYGKYLFYDKTTNTVINNIKNSSVTLPLIRKGEGEKEEKIRNVIGKCLEKNSEQRPLIVNLNKLLEGIKRYNE